VSLSTRTTDSIRLGLEQLPLDGLIRLHEKLVQGAPVLLSGSLINISGTYG